MTTRESEGEVSFLAPDEPVDLSNCEREPIHIPGSIQPRGLLLVVSEPGHVVQQVSDNLPDILGHSVDRVLGRLLADVIGAEAADTLRRHTETFSDLRARNPLLLTVEVPGAEPEVMDAVLHRVRLGAAGGGAVLVVELEPARGPRPFSFPNTYQAVRSAVGELNRAASLQELYDVAAREVRDLTGFDRVMIYRFDAEYNGVVVAEARREDLNSFLGLHYPSTDIPAQARKLYERNWIRLISDVDYTPSRIVPTLNPQINGPIDLTDATLRSVSPIHVEYLQNMGVGASMSISLLRDEKLWGLIACHHYSGSHAPPYGVRAAAEFLGSALSLRLVDRAADEDMRAALASRSALARLVGASQDDTVPLGAALQEGGGLLALVPADGAIVVAESRSTAAGTVPPPAELDRLLTWVRQQGQEVVCTDALAADAPEVAAEVPSVAGLLALVLPEYQVVLWVREETLRSVDWGGDPSNKAIARREGDDVRISPRKSFERWREVVRGRSEPWSAEQVEGARALRGHLVEILYGRDRRKMQAAEIVQRSLLPLALPALPGWALEARYQPALGGRVGGDWYDAFQLPDGRLGVVVGDVAGHGLEAAGTMAQLRNGLRAYLLRGDSPAAALGALDALADWMLPGQMATIVVAVIDPSDGSVELASAGHLPPCVVDGSGVASFAVTDSGLPLGVLPEALPSNGFTIPVGGCLALYTDGMVERRGESLDDGMERLADLLGGPDPLPRLDEIVTDCRAAQSSDDATLIVVRRTGA